MLRYARLAARVVGCRLIARLRRALRCRVSHETGFMQPPIARLQLLAVRASGDRFPLTIEIGTPYEDPDHGAWRCPVSLAELYRRLPDLAGGDSFQALCVAIKFVGRTLSHFIEDGGKLFFLGGEGSEHEFPLDAYFDKH
jgi:hypothetical protein